MGEILFESSAPAERDLPTDLRGSATGLLGWAEVTVDGAHGYNAALKYAGRVLVAEGAELEAEPGEMTGTAPYHCCVKYFANGTLAILAGYDGRDNFAVLVPSDPNAKLRLVQYARHGQRNSGPAIGMDNELAVRRWAREHLDVLWRVMRADTRALERETGKAGRQFFGWIQGQQEV